MTMNNVSNLIYKVLLSRLVLPHYYLHVNHTPGFNVENFLNYLFMSCLRTCLSLHTILSFCGLPKILRYNRAINNLFWI